MELQEALKIAREIIESRAPDDLIEDIFNVAKAEIKNKQNITKERVKEIASDAVYRFFLAEVT